MSEADPTTEARIQVERELQRLEAELAKANTPGEVAGIVAGSEEYVRRLGHLPELHERAASIEARARAVHRAFSQLLAEFPAIRDAQSLVVPASEIALAPMSVAELRELATHCYTAAQQPYATDAVHAYLEALMQLVREALTQKLGADDVFIELLVTLPIDVSDEVQALNAQVERLASYLPRRMPQRNTQEVLADEWQLDWRVRNALILRDEGVEETTDDVWVARILLALRDYWDYYWLAQTITPELRAKLFAFGQTYAPLLMSTDTLPSAVKQMLLATMRREPPPEDIYDALEAFTYALVNEDLITYAQATRLVKEVTGRTVSVEAWAKRLTRWADRNGSPRIDGRKLTRGNDSSQLVRVSLARLFKSVLQ